MVRLFGGQHKEAGEEKPVMVTDNHCNRHINGIKYSTSYGVIKSSLVRIQCLKWVQYVDTRVNLMSLVIDFSHQTNCFVSLINTNAIISIQYRIYFLGIACQENECHARGTAPKVTRE